MEDIVERIEFLLSTKKITSSAFAERVGIQKSSMSHILNRRNKPSLDFITKVANAFPKVSIEWLITGNKKVIAPTNISLPKETPSLAPPTSPKQNKQEIERIIICYKNGTFETYTQ